MKTIGLDGSRAFLTYRTGIEEYSYQVIKNLRQVISEETRVFIYVRKRLRIRKGKLTFVYPVVDFALPQNWQLVGIWAPRFWTQIGLSLRMVFFPVDTLFVPAHTLPIIGGRRNVVTVHGLEYEVSPESYSFLERLYMRFSIRYSCFEADTVIAVSENTKKDLLNLYNTPEEKIKVIGEGYEEKYQVSSIEYQKGGKGTNPYLLFVGRIEERKNVARIIEAFEFLKKGKRHSNLQLVLVGKPGYGYDRIASRIKYSEYGEDIQEMGYVHEKEKRELMQNAKAFVFPSLYEGFGLPVLEAQALGTLVVTSNTSSLPEVGGEGALYVNPLSVESITEGLEKALAMNEQERGELGEKMRENLERFSWKKCVREIASIL
ncbi:MAG: glycosyltransferase family 4 protein [Candidatus Moranbacteria bacterium]|nr:glycosyltransferase family 4 protein [Candidatus Moranbacteria bacterium]